MLTKGQPMHIDTANKVTVSRESTDLAVPLPIARLMFMSTSGTLATRSSFRASEARDVSLFAFVGEIVYVFAILPQRHPLVMVSPVVVITYPSRVANKERSYFVGNTEVNHLPAGFVAHVTDTSLGPSANLIPGTLQFLPTARILCASALLPGKLTKLLATLSFERADAAPRHNDGLAGVRGHAGKMNFTQVNRRALHYRMSGQVAG